MTLENTMSGLVALVKKLFIFVALLLLRRKRLHNSVEFNYSKSLAHLVLLFPRPGFMPLVLSLDSSTFLSGRCFFPP
jgi:hypothetical protein